MPHWLIKSALQRAISLLPASQTWNSLFQRHLTRSLELTPARFEARLEFCRRHLDHFRELRPEAARDFSVVELGTGWYPVVPLGFYLCGAREIQTFDIDPLLSTSRLEQTLRRFCEHDQTGALSRFLPGVQPERMIRLREVAPRSRQLPPEALLRQFNIHPHVRDAQHTGLSSGTTDLLVSTSVLQYIPPQVLKTILSEFRRVGSPGAIQSHYVNLVDQYSYFDPSITPFNFLQYPSQRWKFFNSPLTWQNRLRISDLRQLFSDAGYQITRESNTSGSLDDLRKIRLAREFQNYSTEDLLVTTSWLVARPQGS